MLLLLLFLFLSFIPYEDNTDETCANRRFLECGVATEIASSRICGAERPVYDTYVQDVVSERATHPVRELRKHYIFSVDDGHLQDFLARHPRLYSLLANAVNPLSQAFGERKQLELQLLESDDDSVLRVMVRLPLEAEKPAESMREFKSDWWLKHSSHSLAALVFDYETGNG